jgi:hypothetical protein
VVCGLSGVLEGGEPAAVEVLATAGRHVGDCPRLSATGSSTGAGLTGRRGCITAPVGCQGDTAATLRGHADLQGPQACRVRSLGRGFLRPRSVVSGQPRVRIIEWARYSGRECLGAYFRRACVCARGLRPPRPIGCVSLQDLETAAAQLWPQTRSQGYFEGWGLDEGGRGSACRPQSAGSSTPAGRKKVRENLPARPVGLRKKR